MLLQIKFVQCKTWCKWGCHYLHQFLVSALFASLFVMCSPWGIILVTKITMQGVVYIKFEPYSCWYFFKPFCRAIFASYFNQKSAFLSCFGVNMHHLASLWIMLSVTPVTWFSLLVLNDRTFALCFPLKCHVFLFVSFQCHIFDVLIYIASWLYQYNIFFHTSPFHECVAGASTIFPLWLLRVC